ncbi:unnamed protein product, partial [Mesorhabditis belari]|uniref:Uncharacterized protein n=1 Tax=Mesorhabditis belari TaxID=2138241 RepID=A0AAF3EF03_9BILA
MAALLIVFLVLVALAWAYKNEILQPSFQKLYDVHAEMESKTCVPVSPIVHQQHPPSSTASIPSPISIVLINNDPNGDKKQK